MTAKELEAVLRPSDAPATGPWRTAMFLALKHPSVTIKAAASAVAWPDDRAIGTPPVRDDGDLAMAPEISHVLDAQLFKAPTLVGEFPAWVGAIHLLGAKWSPAMHRRLMGCLPTYRGELALEPGHLCARRRRPAAAVLARGDCAQ